MSAFGGLKFTQKGINLQAKAQAGAELQYTRIGIGDGNYSGDILNITNLVHQVMSLPISSISVSSGEARIASALSNQDLATGFYLREIGVFAIDPDEGEILYCYANAGEYAGYIPPAGGGDVLEKEVELITTVGSASNVTAVIDGSLVYATVSDITEIKANYLGCAQTAGTGAAYTVKFNPAPTVLADFMRVTVKIHADNTGAATLNVNELGAKPLKKGNGNDFKAGQLKAGSIYTFVYNATTGNFIAQGEGGEYGTAGASDVLVGKTIGTDVGIVTGSLAPRFTNLLRDGNFENYSGLAGFWDANGDVSGYNLNTTKGKFGPYALFQMDTKGNYQQTFFTPIENHIYYLSAWGNFPTSTAAGFTQIASLEDFSANVAAVNISNSIYNLWQFGSAMYTSNGSTLTIYAGLMGDGSAYQVYIDGLMLIDLTDAFGAGNEPSQATMDAIVQAAGGWWETPFATMALGVDLRPTVLLSGYSGWNSEGALIKGTVAQYSGTTAPASLIHDATNGQVQATVPKGYWDGSSSVVLSDANFASKNILTGASMFGLSGALAPKLINMLNNTSFEAAQAFSGWMGAGNTSGMTISSGGKFGTYCLNHITAGGCYRQNISVVSGHKYYFSCWGNISSPGPSSFNMFAGYYLPSSNGTYWLAGDKTKLNTWQFASSLITSDGTAAQFQVGVWSNGEAYGVKIDGLMLIDLTDAFGAGNEPSQATMDAIVQARGGWWDSQLTGNFKNSSSGTITSSSTQLSFYNGSATINAYYILIPSFPYRPNRLLISQGGIMQSAYDRTLGSGNYASCQVGGSLYQIAVDGSQGSGRVDSNSIMLPVTYASQSYTWWASE